MYRFSGKIRANVYFCWYKSFNLLPIGPRWVYTFTHYDKCIWIRTNRHGFSQLHNFFAIKHACKCLIAILGSIILFYSNEVFPVYCLLVKIVFYVLHSLLAWGSNGETITECCANIYFWEICSKKYWLSKFLKTPSHLNSGSTSTGCTRDLKFWGSEEHSSVNNGPKINENQVWNEFLQIL